MAETTSIKSTPVRKPAPPVVARTKSGMPPMRPRPRKGPAPKGYPAWMVPTGLAAVTVAIVAAMWLSGLPATIFDHLTQPPEVPIVEGLVGSASGPYAHNPLVVVAPKGGGSYYVKVVSRGDGHVEKAVFLRGGSKFHATIDVGSYVIRYATGSKWRGDKSLFGSRSAVMEYDDTLTFGVNEKNDHNGYEVILGAPIGGRKAVHSVDPKAF